MNDDWLALGCAVLAIMLALVGIVLPEPIQGIQGIQGVIGYNGSQGIQGVIGYNGSQGIQGVIGYNGSQGIQGIQGISGINGTNGINGTDAPSITLMNGLICWLPLNDGIGNASDYSGFMNHGLISGALWVDGKYGKALSFNGSEYVNLGSQVLPTIAFTYCLWVKNPVNFGSGGVGMFISPNSGSGWFGYHKSNKLLGFGGLDGAIWSLYSFTDLNPHFCVATYNGVTLKMYVDLVEVYSNLMSNIVPVGNTFLGKNVDSNFLACNYLDEVRIYNRALTQAEITLLYNLP